jgi:hypothetical protein
LAGSLIAGQGIGGTDIVGVVTGFALICVDGLDVRLDKTGPVSINGTSAAAGQLRVGQLVVIKVSGLRQSDETIIAIRLDDVRVGTLAVRGQINREYVTA